MEKNEAEICEMVIRRLEAEASMTRGAVCYPEEDGSGPPVEVRVEIGRERFALEHTLVEPFPEAIRTGKDYASFVKPIEQALAGVMPVPGVYHLHFPVDPTEKRHRRTHAALQRQIVEWVSRAAQELHAQMPRRLSRERSPFGHRGVLECTIDGLPLRLERQLDWSQSGKHDGKLFAYRVVGSDLEQLRERRIGIALDRKLGKLAACAREGDHTVLILESSDLVLSNQVFIATALETALKHRDFAPDQIFIADTAIPESWSLFRPVHNGRFTLDMPYLEVERSKAAGAPGQQRLAADLAAAS